VDPAIQLHGVSKAFGSTSAVDRLDVLVPDYGLHGFIGPNGARKTTVLRS
jgi:ABC-2 type transport system ATP-binding protein